MLLNKPDEGPYSRFNARRASPAQVASDFVAPQEYWELAGGTDPQLLIGPRGIGKTTLLKMLVGEALEAWDGSDADRARRAVRFTGAFVAADRMWAGQLDQLEIGVPAEHRSRFGVAALTYMTLTALAQAALRRIDGTRGPRQHLRVDLSPAAEQQLAENVTAAWNAHPATASISALEDQTAANVAHIGRLMQTVANPDLSGAEVDEVVRHPLLDIELFSAALLFVQQFNKAVDQRDHPWVILIDEFEFLPPASRVQLGAAFQGRSPILSYKMSIAPYTGLDPFEGMPLNDWSKVRLAHPKREQSHAFTERIVTRQIALAAAALGKDASRAPKPADLLGPGGFEPREDESYGQDSQNARDIAELAELDPQFVEWFKRKIGADGLRDITLSPTYSNIRKAMPLIRLRLEYRKVSASAARSAGRSRHRIPDLYAGKENVYAMAEGNPRWIKALIHALLEKWNGGRTIPRARQAAAIHATADELYNTLKAVPVDHLESNPSALMFVGDSLSPFELTRALGEYVERRTHSETFTPDLPGAFRVDVNDPWVKDVVNSLVFLGALVYEPPRPGQETDVVRLAHMWAPLFRLLPRKGKERSLRAAMREGDALTPHVARGRRSIVSPGQTSLERQQR